MHLKIYTLINTLCLLLSPDVFAQPEHYVRTMLANIRSFNQETIHSDKIQMMTVIYKGTFSDDLILKCIYDREGRLTDSIGYAADQLLEKYEEQVSSDLPINPEYCEDGKPLAFRFRFGYNEKGLRVSMEEHRAGVSESSEVPVYSDRVLLYSYDPSGRITKVDFMNGRGIRIQQDLLEYDKAGNLAEWTQFQSGSPDNFTCSFVYDHDNRLIEYSKTDGSGYFDSHERFAYNNRGKLETWEDLSKSGLTIYKKDFKYDDAGNMIECLGYLEGEDFTSKLEQTFNADGNLMKSTVSRGHITRSGDFTFRESKRRNYMINDDKSILQFRQSLYPAWTPMNFYFEYDWTGHISKALGAQHKELTLQFIYFDGK